MEGTSGRTGTVTDLDGDTKIEAGEWGEVLFIRRFAFGRVIDLHSTTKDFRSGGFRIAFDVATERVQSRKSGCELSQKSSVGSHWVLG